jgi:biotin carboxyl carrier protein
MPERIRIKKRKRIITAIVAAIAVVLLIIGFLSFRKTRAEMARAQALRSISSAQLSRRSIRTTVVGNGTLTGGDAEELKVPKGVIVKKVYVKSGDSVRKGDLLASLDPESVRKLIAEVHEKIAAIDDKLLQIEEYDEDEEIKAPVTGTVTQVFVRDGSYIPDIMERNGSLMTLTADSSMKKFPVGALTGEVLEIYVTEGDRVYQGDPLLLIRTVKDEARRRQLLNDREGLSFSNWCLSEGFLCGGIGAKLPELSATRKTNPPLNPNFLSAPKFIRTALTFRSNRGIILHYDIFGSLRGSPITKGVTRGA